MGFVLVESFTDNVIFVSQMLEHTSTPRHQSSFLEKEVTTNSTRQIKTI